jgi:DNA-binding response OmpR family regulator
VVFFLFPYKFLSDVLCNPLCDDIGTMMNNSMENILNTNLVILVVSPPGDLQIGLQALLTTHLEGVDVLVVSERSSALKVIDVQKPALVILDQDIPGNITALLVQKIKTNWPGICCLVLVNDDQYRRMTIDAGADLTVIKGLPGAKLIAEIKRLLSK